MVQLLLARSRRNATLLAVCVIIMAGAVHGLGKKDKLTPVPMPPDLLLEGNRKLSFVQSFSSEREAGGKPGFFVKLVDLIAGDPTNRKMIRPYGIAVDSRGRIIVTDPGAEGIHIFDFGKHKYKFVERRDKDKDPMRQPQCVAVDADDNIYVTDSESGYIFVFDPHGGLRRMIGSLKGGEGFFKRPTGIAVDSEAGRIYVTDTLRDKIFVLDMEGSVLRTIGDHGTEPGDLYYPTELRLTKSGLIAVDSMNFRVQLFSLDGVAQSAIGRIGDGVGGMFRPKGISVDSEDHIYVVDGLWGVVQIFDRQGQLLYYFGQRGSQLGEFQLPSGLFIDKNDRIYIADSYNARVQVFQYYGTPAATEVKKK
ncbi:MAG: 6-bladed beta-propeller [Terriglobales bacterium]